MTDRPWMETEALIAAALGPLEGLDAVDIGAGSGRVTRMLAAAGARTTGVEPNAAVVARARETGGADYVVAPAEATGLPAACADIVLFSMSLHHCADMGAALDEALRLLRPGGRLAVIEPEAPDPIWPVARFVDDESAVYAEAQAALGRLVAEGRVGRPETRHAVQRYAVETAEAMLDDLRGVDPARRLDPADRPAFEAAFAEAHRRDAEGGHIPHWVRIDVFGRGA